ncbi:dienelactone hydrolase family protein [Verrucomicrobiales bacterium BCK34]|nr:dienelactone hydrolase family protein [Verrucomicrobiales bacterium BCK34]
MNTKSISQYTLTLALLFAFLPATNAEEIDWERARELRQKMKSGETLSEVDSAYLEKATEARKGMRTATADPTRGDGSDEVATVAPVEVSEEDSPVKTLTATASDGNEIEFAYRVPKADRPLPAIIFIHGSLGQSRIRELVHSARTNPTHTRFLDAGYVAVAATFRTYGREPLSRGPVLDLIAIVQKVKKLPEVDPESVVIFGTSGGGHIGLELAGSDEVSFPAVVIGEPASVLYTGLMTGIEMRDRSMKEYATLYTDEHRKATEAKIAAISCPILVHHGDVHLLKNINFDIVFPAIEKAGKTLVIKRYPGEDHGFYWGNRTSEATVDLVVANTRAFIEPLLKTKPAGQ